MQKKRSTPSTKLATRLRGVITDIEKLLADTIGLHRQREKMTVPCARMEGFLIAAKSLVEELEQAKDDPAQDAACSTGDSVYEKLWQAIGIAMKIESSSSGERLNRRASISRASNNLPQRHRHLGGLP